MKIFIVAILMAFLISSCVSRKEVEASIWLNNFMGDETTDSTQIKAICERAPEIKQYGFYRKLKTGKIEFISMCNPQARNMLSIQKDDFQRLLDEALPKPQDNNN